MKIFSREDSLSLALTGIAADFAFFVHLGFLLTVILGLRIWHPLLWVHVVVMLACALFMYTASSNMNNRVPVVNEKVLAIGRKAMAISAIAVPLMWVFGIGIGALLFESVRGTPNDMAFIQKCRMAISGAYLLSLFASISSAGLITSGLYDVQG